MIRTLLRGRRLTWVALALIAAAVIITDPFAPDISPNTNTATPAPSATSPSATAVPSRAASTRPKPRRTPETGTDGHGHADGHGHDGTIREFTAGPSTPPAPAARRLVTQFARAWIRRDLPADKWWAGINVYCEPSYAEQLRTADPGRIPADRLTGKPTAVLSRSDLAVYAVPTNTGTLQVTVAPLTGGWAVTRTRWKTRE